MWGATRSSRQRGVLDRNALYLFWFCMPNSEWYHCQLLIHGSFCDCFFGWM